VSEVVTGTVEYNNIIKGHVLHGTEFSLAGSVLGKYCGKTVRVTIDEVTDFSIKRGDTTYSIFIYPDCFEVRRDKEGIITSHTFNTHDIGPEHVKARQDRAALKAVLAMLDEIDSSLFLGKKNGTC
jgi:hypothetical protein